MRQKFFWVFVHIFCLISFPVRTNAEPIAPTDVTILTKEDFVGRPFYSVADALEGISSLNLEQDGGRGTKSIPKIRGLSSSQFVKVLLDGKPFTHEFDGEVDLAQIPLTVVERIEITRGGESVAYGSEGVAGTINIVTIRPDLRGLVSRIGTGVGRDGVKHSQGQFRGRSGFGDITYAGSRQVSGGFATNEETTANSHFLNVTRTFNGKGHWGAEYYFQESEVELGQGTPVPLSEWNGHLEQLSSDPSSLKTQETHRGKFLLASPAINDNFFYLTLTQSKRELKLKSRPDGPAFRDQKSLSSSLDLKWKRKEFEAGMETYIFKREIFPESTRVAYQNGFYALHKWSTKNWVYLPGVRYDHHSKARGDFTPRLAAIYSPAESIAVSATSQLAHRTPQFDELFLSSSAIANSILESEKSHSTDLGIRWKPNGSVDLKLTGFFITVKNLIQTDPVTNKLQNRGRENTRGIESEFSINIGSKTRYRRFTLSGNGSVQRSRRDSGPNSSTVDSPLSPKRMGLFRLDYHLPRSITLSNELRYQSEQYEWPNRQGVRLPSYHVWNSHFGMKILSADLYFEIQNVTGRRFADALGRNGSTTTLAPQPTRTFWTGITIRFEN